MIKLILINAKNINDSEERNNYYHRAMNLMYFYDGSNQASLFNKLNQIYEEANQVWDNDIKFVFVNCTNSKSSTPNLKIMKLQKNINVKFLMLMLIITLTILTSLSIHFC